MAGDIPSVGRIDFGPAAHSVVVDAPTPLTQKRLADLEARLVVLYQTLAILTQNNKTLSLMILSLNDRLESLEQRYPSDDTSRH